MKKLVAAALLLGSTVAPALAQQTYQAAGTEPFWSATIGERTITLKQAGLPDLTVTKPRPIIGFNGERYETPRLSLDITHVKCSDGMSDRVYRDTVVIAQGKRTLRGCGGETSAIARPGAAISSIEGDWTIQSINGRPVAPRTAPQVSFRDGRVSGNASCNRFNGRFELARGRLIAGPLASTKMACVHRAANVQEESILRLLGERLTVSSNRSGKLVLTGAGGKTLTLVARRR